MTKKKSPKKVFKDGYSSHPWTSADEFLAMKLAKDKNTRWAKLYHAVNKIISKKVKSGKVKIADIGFTYVDTRLPADVKKYTKEGQAYAIRNAVDKEMMKIDKKGNSKPVTGTISFELIRN